MVIVPVTVATALVLNVDFQKKHLTEFYFEIRWQF